MTNIFVKVNGASIQATADGKITSGMVGLPVEITYDDSWQGLYKTAFFKSGNFVRKVDSVSNSAIVPWEVLRKSGNQLEIGIEGRTIDGDIVIPTIWTTAGMIFQGAKGDIPAAPVTGSDTDPGTTDGYIDSSGKASGNIDMDGHAIRNAWSVDINQKGEEGVSIYAGAYEAVDGETEAAILEFYGTHGDEWVRLRNIAPGVNDDDSVTVGQMKAAVGDIEPALDSIIAIQKELIGVITFTIGDAGYQALNGMTWGQWVESEYNMDGFVIDDEGVLNDADMIPVYDDVHGATQYENMSPVDGAVYIV